jgi:hypothetical protein
MSPPSPQPAAGTVAISRWIITTVPPGWGFIPGYGLRSLANTPNPPSLLLSEDVLPGGDKLAPYLQSQNTLLAKTFPLAQIVGPAEGKLTGADEVQMLILKHQGPNGGVFLQVQTYARCIRWIGIVTLTATADDLPNARAAMNDILAGLRIAPESTPA